MDNRILARHGIMEMSAYIPGKPVEEVQRELGLTDVIKLASNENPLGTSPMALNAMHEELAKAYMYPEGTSPSVRNVLSVHHGIPADWIYVANGGDHCINLICQAYVNEGEEVIVGKPFFKTYESSAQIMGGKLVEVPLQNRVHDLDAMAAAITERTKLIFICNPANPTGTIVKRQALEAFLNKVPDRCITIIDEAYFEFADDPDYPNGLDYVLEGKHNVIVLRTFSKVYGLAGVRVGYVMAQPPLIEPLMRVMPPFPVNRIAQAGAVAALSDKAFLADILRVNAQGRDYLYREFTRLHMDYALSQANFVFVDMGMPAKEICPALLRRGIIVRPAGPWGFPTSIRVTIGKPEENERFIKALTELQDRYQKGETL